MIDLKRISRENDTSIEILRAIAEQRGDDERIIRETLDAPADLEALVTRARQMLDDPGDELRWQGRAIL